MGDLYKSIKSLCDEKGVSGGKMCTEIGISKSTMTDLKSGRRTGISLDTAQKIADYFGVSVDRVLGAEQRDEQKENLTDKNGEVPNKLEDSDYFKLNNENRALIDSMIEKLLKSQSDE